ncbi:hypothetical protein DUK53_11730 [Listeria sp. SHR_NRA_18]|nr:hypothetical protein DUK53_11730 [Listeria sp. SHR_NRA_18]
MRGASLNKDLHISSIVQQLLKKWYIVLGIASLFILLVYVTQNYLVERQYEAKTELLILPNKNNAEANNDANVRLNIQLMNTYMNVMKSSNTISKVKQELGLDESVEALQKRLVVASDENSLSVNLKITSNTPESAAQIANQLTKTTQNELKTYFPDNKVVILNPAGEGKLISNRLYYLLAGFIGAWVGIMLILIEVVTARVIRSEADLKQFKFPVLGAVAYSEDERK